jgi:large subunit ribosomal protein L10
MAKTRAEKEALVTQMAEDFQSTKIAVLTRFSGVSVSEMGEMRQSLREAGGSYRVVKNTLARIAAKGTPAESLFENLEGAAGIAFSSDDPVGLAKVLSKTADDVAAFEFEGGVLDANLLAKTDIEQLAKLPSREELIAKAVGSMKAPIQNLHGVLHGVMREFVYVLEAVRKKKEEAA